MKRLDRLKAYLDNRVVDDDPWWERERARVNALWQHEGQAFPGWVVGTDEVGRGPMAGPLIAAAATSNQPVFIPGLNDSKKLTAEEREIVALLIEKSSLRVELEVISVERISQGNLHHLSLEGMLAALKRLKVRPQLVLVDGKYPLPSEKLRQRPLVGGDRQSALIAAASIVAKVTRDACMQALAKDFPGYGWVQNVGYPTQEHREALIRLGATPHHRRNYRPVKAQLPTQLNFEGLL